MIRLDKYLCDMGIGSRSEVKNFIRRGQIAVNGQTVKSPELKVDEKSDRITYNGNEIQYAQYRYFMLNKPAGVVSAVKDRISDTVIELLGNPGAKDLFPVGRLDKDTEGLLLITNDGMLAHELLSPKKHVDKTYYVQIAKKMTDEDRIRLEQGVDIGEEKLTLPAKVEILSEKEILLTIQEGKFHQVKRMLAAVGNEVCYLKRISMGTLQLDETLPSGAYRELTEEEIALLKNGRNCR